MIEAMSGEGSSGRWRSLFAAAVAVAALVALPSCRRAEPPEPPPAGTPRLAVVVVADQFLYEYLDRVRPLVSGGLARLLAEGVSFTEAHHGHAVTVTAVGQAVLSTGAHPARSGIVGNDWLDRETGEEVYCVEDPEHEISPRNLLVRALGDWLQERYPEAKVYSAGGKDRSAVLMGGQRPDGVFWYDREDGGFTTSSYYPEPPEWVGAFEDEGVPPELFLGAAWEPLPVDPAAAEAAGFAPLDRGPFDRGFPRVLGNFAAVPNERFYYDLYDSPFGDEHLGRFALRLVEEEELGADEWPDLLALSFASLDNVGHDYGPHSPEVLDTLLRLDRVLGELFALLDERVGRDGWVVALSSDHGVIPLPESPAGAAAGARRSGLAEVRCVRRAGTRLVRRFGTEIWRGSGDYLDPRALDEAGLDAAEVEAAVARELERCPNVARVWTRSGLAASPAPVGPFVPGSATWYELLYRNALHPERSPNVFLQPAPYQLDLLGALTTHGSPYAYDTHVPFVVAGPGIAPATVAETVLTVDLAPTLAELLAVPVPEEIDGVSRAGRLR